MSPTLGLHYAPHLDATTLDALEAAARRTGLPLWQVELLGQDATVAHGFAQAARNNDASAFLTDLDWGRLENLFQSHRITMPVPLAR